MSTRKLSSAFLTDKHPFYNRNSCYDSKGHNLAFHPVLAILNLQLTPVFTVWLLSPTPYYWLISCHQPISLAQTYSLCQDGCRRCWIHSLLPALQSFRHICYFLCHLYFISLANYFLLAGIPDLIPHACGFRKQVQNLPMGLRKQCSKVWGS